MCGESKSGYNVDTTYYISAAKPAFFRYLGKCALGAFTHGEFLIFIPEAM